MPRHLCLILHPKAAVRADVRSAVESVRQDGVDLRVRIPWDAKDVKTTVEEALAAGSSRLIAGGGDGTVNALVNILVADGDTPPRAELGILPLGTANDFARGCGLDLNDLAACLHRACGEETRAIDVGRMNGRSFLNVTSAGFGAEITAMTPNELKNALGGAAYTLMGLVKVFTLHPYTGRLLVPGRPPEPGSMLFMAVANNRFAGGGFEVARFAELDDGLLDLVSLGPDSKLNLKKLAAELKDPLSGGNEYIYYEQLSEFVIESDEELHMNLDGEPVSGRRFAFSILPRHLRIAL